MLKKFGKLSVAGLVALAAFATVTTAQAADISGAGSTFVYPILAKWADAYKTTTDLAVNYQSIGSGGGIKQIKAKTVDFGATDKPLAAADLESFGFAQFPVVMGAIVPVVNLTGVKPGEMRLNGQVLAEIYLGNIKNWNDPQIAALNKSVKLPDQAITVVHRSDGSGTTYNFAYYLNAVDTKWSDVGVDTSIEWPVGLGGKGNEGVAALVGQTSGSIGYVEYAYAKQNNLTYTDMINLAGKTVSPSLESIQAAATNADWKGTPGFGVILANQPGAKSWPMTASTFVLVYKSQDKPERAKEVLKFFTWSFEKGGKLAEELVYVPMPEKVVKQIEESWKSVVDTKGKPIL